MDQVEVKTQRICAKLVDREVLACASSMVYDLSKNASGSEPWYEDLIDLCMPRRPDEEIEKYTEILDDLEKDLEDTEGVIEMLEEDPETDPPDLEHAKETLARITKDIAETESQLETLEAYEDNEIFEHWIVTGWLGERLREQGETVGELFNFTIWGRQTTGQRISMDGVIRQIASNMEILPGQKNEWTDN